MFFISYGLSHSRPLGISSQVYRQFYLDSYFTRDDVIDAVSEIKQEYGYSTNTGLALWHMRRRMFSKKHGGRDGVAKVIMRSLHDNSNISKCIIVLSNLHTNSLIRK